jgi:retinol dehydrogenase 12
VTVQGKTMIVTGANTGIGLETAAGLAKLGARVVLTSRDDAKGAAAVAEIKGRMPEADVHAMNLDLSTLAGVRSFASRFLDSHDSLDVLVNNAGLLLDHRTITPDGFETTFQVNHLGPFLLTNLLLDRIKASAPARIVNVASTAHRGTTLDFDDLHSEQGFQGMRVYGKTKLCNILFTRELARRLEGTGVTANSLHPGTVRTGFGMDGDAKGLLRIGLLLARPFFKSPATGAKTSIHLATANGLEGHTGEYWSNIKPSKPSDAATDDDAARRLWDISAELVGLS